MEKDFQVASRGRGGYCANSFAITSELEASCPCKPIGYGCISRSIERVTGFHRLLIGS